MVKALKCKLIQLLESILNSNFLIFSNWLSLPLRLGVFIVSRSELVFLNSNLWVKEAISIYDTNRINLMNYVCKYIYGL